MRAHHDGVRPVLRQRLAPAGVAFKRRGVRPVLRQRLTLLASPLSGVIEAPPHRNGDFRGRQAIQQIVEYVEVDN